MINILEHNLTLVFQVFFLSVQKCAKNRVTGMKPMRSSKKRADNGRGLPSRINITRNTSIRGKLPPLHHSVGAGTGDDKTLASPDSSLRGKRSMMRQKDSVVNVLGSRESRMRMRAKIDKRRQESSLDVGLETASRRRRRSALDINKIKVIEDDAINSLIISQTDLAEKNRMWMRQTPLHKFKLLQKRVILIIRCYSILKSYAYDGRSGK